MSLLTLRDNNGIESELSSLALGIFEFHQSYFYTN